MIRIQEHIYYKNKKQWIHSLQKQKLGNIKTSREFDFLCTYEEKKNLCCTRKKCGFTISTKKLRHRKRFVTVKSVDKDKKSLLFVKTYQLWKQEKNFVKSFSLSFFYFFKGFDLQTKKKNCCSLQKKYHLWKQEKKIRVIIFVVIFLLSMVFMICRQKKSLQFAKNNYGNKKKFPEIIFIIFFLL